MRLPGKLTRPTRNHIKIEPKNLVTIGKQMLNEPEWARETLTGGALRLVRLAKTLPKGFVMFQKAKNFLTVSLSMAHQHFAPWPFMSEGS